MKAISLHQPWASLIMLGAKRVETRSWQPPAALIGERIAIHAAKRIDECVLEPPFSDLIRDPARDAPVGVLLGSVLLEGAWQLERSGDVMLVTHEYHRTNPHESKATPVYDDVGIAAELVFGDFTIGRWAWGLSEVRKLNEPVPFSGGQRFFEVNVEELLKL